MLFLPWFTVKTLYLPCIGQRQAGKSSWQRRNLPLVFLSGGNAYRAAAPHSIMMLDLYYLAAVLLKAQHRRITSNLEIPVFSFKMCSLEKEVQKNPQNTPLCSSRLLLQRSLRGLHSAGISGSRCVTPPFLPTRTYEVPTAHFPAVLLTSGMSPVSLLFWPTGNLTVGYLAPEICHSFW